MYILGLNAYHADSSAAILKDGVLIAATEEERFTRVKHWAGFPAQAIAFCLREAGITLEEVDHITIGRDPRAKIANKALTLLRDPFAGFGNVFDRLRNRGEIKGLEQEFQEAFGEPSGKVKDKLRYIEHHRSHLASSFFASPFEEAALLSIDGSGDFTTTMIGVGQGNQIEVLDSIDFPVSIGLFYTAFTQYLCFPHYGDEYKIMGLAPYGKPVYYDQVAALLNFKANGLYDWDQKYFKKATQVRVRYEDHVPSVDTLYTDALVKEFGPVRGSSEPLDQHHKDLAASVQQVTEDLIMHLLDHLQSSTGLRKVCLAGGVAQNSVANGKVDRKNPV